MATTHGGRTFDRVVKFDERSRQYNVADLLDEGATAATSYDKKQDAKLAALDKRLKAVEAKVNPTPPPTPTPTPTPTPSSDVVWDVPTWLDQLQTGMCVGYGWTNDAQSSPSPDTIVPGKGGDDPGSTPARIYFKAQDINGQPHDDQAGTDVLAGAKAAQSFGFITSYSWAFNVGDVVAAIQQLGPVVFGLDWFEGMMDVDSKGFIHPSGTVVGGHCILGHSVSADGKTITLRNSWGKDWGVQGDAHISTADLATLLARQGEACVPKK